MGSAVIGGLAAGAAGGVSNGIVGIRQNSYQAHLQEELAAAERQFNAEEAEKSRRWSTNERLAQQLYNTGEREATQAYNTSERLATQQYNSPAEMAKRLRGAGINPAVYFSGNGPNLPSSSPQSSSPASSSVPSAAVASSSSSAPNVANIPQLLTGAGDMIRALTDANVGEKSISLIDANVEKALSEVYTNQQIAQAKELENQLNRAKLPHNIRKAILEVSSLAAQIGLTHDESEKAKAQKKLIELQSKTEEKIADLKGSEALTASLFLKKAPRLWESEIRSNEASANQANTQSEVNKQEKRVREVLANLKENSYTSELNSVLHAYIAKVNLSDADSKEALNRLSALSNMRDGSIREKVDDLLIWLKSRISPFGK